MNTLLMQHFVIFSLWFHIILSFKEIFSLDMYAIMNQNKNAEILWNKNKVHDKLF